MGRDRVIGVMVGLGVIRRDPIGDLDGDHDGVIDMRVKLAR